MTSEINSMKFLVSEFQEEVKSNNLLEFCTWYENRIIRMKAMRPPRS